MSDKEYSLDNISLVGDYSIYTTGTALCMPKLLQSLLSSKDKTLRNISASGVLTKLLPDLLKFLSDKGGRCIVEKTTGDYVYVWEDCSFVNVDFNDKNKGISISGYALSKELSEMVSILETDFVTKDKKKLIFSIIRNSAGLGITNMGDGSSPLIPENYAPEVLDDIDYVVASFQKTPPNGRICILNGEPGTGKTHLIRSLLSRIDCVFLIVPSNLIDSLDKPEFMPLLLSIKTDHEKPIIMIIEDGDVCLVPRKGDNISTISSLLNLSDGILGSMMDIKMVISTNAEIRDMDQAIMRPGRLCKNIYVGPLPYEQANTRYQQLMGNTNVKLDYRKYYVLAEIYEKVNNIEVTHTNRQGAGAFQNTRRAIGFNQYNDQDLTINKSDIKTK